MRTASAIASLPGLVLLCLALLLLPATASAQSDNDAVAAELTRMFATGAVDTGSQAVNARLDQVREFYASRSFKPVWTRDTGPKGKAKALLEELKRAPVHALSPEFYNASEIEALMAATDPADLARLDMLLSGAFSEFGRDLANGRIGPLTPGSENMMEPVEISPETFISGAADAGDLRQYASQYLTVDARYFRLIAKLAELTRLDATGRWPELAADGKPIAAGQSDPRIEAIRFILLYSGDLDPAVSMTGQPLDAALQAGVASFQERHGFDQPPSSGPR